MANTEVMVLPVPSRAIKGPHMIGGARCAHAADTEPVPWTRPRAPGVIALVLLEGAHRVFSDDGFFPTIVGGVHRAVAAADRQLMVALADGPESRARIERYVTEQRVDAVIFASAHGVDPLPERLADRGINVVCSGRPLGDSRLPYVDADHRQGVEMAIAHLNRAGRTRIATIAGPQDMVGGLERLAGYRTAISEVGRPPMVAIGDFTRESGAEAMRRLLEANPRLDAVFVASDLMARGALAVLRQAGRRVPDDVAVVGFDDVEIAERADPLLTTVHQPVERLGERLAAQALRLAHAEPIDARVILPTRLVVRHSG
jgi:DNA-binding LacI/PurR family transcriptional regulator